MNPPKSTTSYAQWSFDARRQTLFVRGEQVRLRRGVLKLLVYLMERENEVVSKQDLIANVWEGRHVSDGAIYNRVSALRETILDEDGPGRCIQWEYGNGLRFTRPKLRANEQNQQLEPRNIAVKNPAQELNYKPAATARDRWFDGLSAPEDWQHLMGAYHTIYRTPSWPNKIKIGVSVLKPVGDQVIVWTTERGEDKKIGIRQRARYRGYAEFIDGRVFVIEQNTRPSRAICLTTLDSPHSYRPNIMTGLMHGSSWKLGGAPYATRVVWRRVPDDMSLREAIHRSGAHPEDTREVDDAILKSLGEYCLTFRDWNHPL